MNWSAVLQWEPRPGLGDKCFLPFEAFERLQEFLTGDYADERPPPPPHSARQASIQNRSDSSEDAEMGEEDDDNTDLEGKGREQQQKLPQKRPPHSGAPVAPQTQERRKGQPLTLQFTNQRTGSKVFGGVLEFGASPGSVSLTPYLAKTIMAEEGDSVTVRLVALPKGTFAKLQPLQPDYLEIPDFRAALESLMRSHFTTLTQGEIISLEHQGKTHDILVSELKPATAVSIIGLREFLLHFSFSNDH